MSCQFIVKRQKIEMITQKLSKLKPSLRRERLSSSFAVI